MTTSLRERDAVLAAADGLVDDDETRSVEEILALEDSETLDAARRPTAVDGPRRRRR